MEPPPRKVKVIQELRTVQQEQQAKLHTKHQHESELLEDIREFSQRRAAIEKTYAQALQKLASQYLQKRDASLPDIKEPAGTDNRTALFVWKALLEETEKVAKARVTAAETVSQQVAESIKLQKNCRAQTSKKSEDLTKTWHEEINGTIRELAKAKKNYVESEQFAQEAREKATEAESKLQKGTLKFFQSKTTLQRQTSKLSQRRNTCDKRASHMRNEYMLTIAAANVHQQRYYSTDLPYVMHTLDGDIFERLKEYFSVFSTTEIEASTYSMTCFRKVLNSALMVNRDYHHKCFLLQNPVFTNTLQYRFKPIENDTVKTLVIDEHESLYLDREARKWATQLARESKRTEDAGARLDQIKTRGEQLKGSDSSSDSGLGQEKDGEQSFDSLREELRRAETSKAKAEAKLEVLRDSGINVDQWLDSAYEALAKEAEIKAQTEPIEPSVSSQPAGNESKLESMNSFYNSFDSIDDHDPNESRVNTTQPTQPQVDKCVALYSYEAQREDELTIDEHEYLEIVEESEGDGWIKAKRENGDTGYIPETYVQVQRDHQPVTPTISHQSDYSTSDEPSHTSSQSLNDYEVQAVMGNTATESNRNVVCIVKALYDYTGSSSEELSFPEGAVIKVFRKDENGVDDGYWEGEFNGRVGVFPSILVEEFGAAGPEGLLEAPAAVAICTDNDHISVSTAVLMSRLSPSLRRTAEMLADKLPAPSVRPAEQTSADKAKDASSGQQSHDKSCVESFDRYAVFRMDDFDDDVDSGPPPEFEPPSMPPPPLPDNITMSSLSPPTDFDPSRIRSASVGPLDMLSLENLRGSPKTRRYSENNDNLSVPSANSLALPRSVSQTSVSTTLKPARVAPPPPGGKGKRPLQQQKSSSSQASARYSDDLPVSMV
ncbi:F-BAR and double SH3 domains protein 2-like isoform X2 [Amphiura filiformis]|uniref:F-BAR and double SH3 domains protein 2-like isoform X2 n=1 Tax=Amphiura filiformis TaxID=82378 RepID=UPI003B21372F